MKPTKILSPKAAFDRLCENRDALFVDVRTRAESHFVGRPLGAILIPWTDAPNWNPDCGDFVAQIRQLLEHRPDPKNVEIILICRSGYRSDDAGRCLMRNGFERVSHIKEGFEGKLDANRQRGNINGWRYQKLPWEQS